jgi:hypothetical protein
VVVRWTFTEVWSAQSWTFSINPNEGGSPAFEKQMNITSNVGPYRGGIIQEGRMDPPTISFSGVILTQNHYEMLEAWFMKRVLLDMTDDVGRTFRGVFSQFTPERQRRPYRPWYHTYSAGFTVWGYRNTSGQVLFGTFS